MTTTFRKPTGIPSWPITLLAAGEKNGKTYTAIEATASPLVGHGYVVACGEDDPDEYGQIPGARFDIAEHDGTHRGMLQALKDASAQPRVDPAKPNLLILDGAGRWWELLSDKANEAAHVRAKKAAAKYNKAYDPDDEVTVHPDLWNTAKSRWYDVVDVLRAHDGPVIVTALLENQVVMDAAGKPTKDRHWKIKAQKNLSADVGAVIEAPEYREWYVTGTRSVRMEPVKTGVYNRDTMFRDFSMDAFWRALGLDVLEQVGTRSHNVMSTAGDDSEDAIVVDEFLNDVAEAVASPLENRLAALRYVYSKFGEATLRGMQVTAPDGSACTGFDLIAGWRAQIDQQLAHARTQQEQGARTPAAQQQEPARAEQPAERAPEPAAKRAADAYQEKQDARAARPTDMLRVFLESELTGQAAVLGAPSLLSYVAHMIPDGKKLEDVDKLALRAYAVKQRPGVIEGLRAQGRVTEADAYARVTPSTFQLWEVLTETAGVDEPAREAAHA